MISQEDALRIATSNLGITPIEDEPENITDYVYDNSNVIETVYGNGRLNDKDSKLFNNKTKTAAIMYYPQEGEYRLLYEVKIDNWIVYVDAVNGSIIDKINNLKFESVTASGNDLFGTSCSFNATRTGQIPEEYVYTMVDQNRQITIYQYDSDLPLPGVVVSSSTDVFNNPSAVSAIYNLSKVYDWYKNTFGRDSYDDNFAPIEVTVNHPLSPYGWNAWWDGGARTFAFTVSDNTSSHRPMNAALDIVAHEYTHAVVDSEVELYYNTIEGGINESLADTMSIMMDTANWTQGEDAFINGGYIRDMKNPTYKNFPEEVETDPHDSGEILNYAAYKVTSSLGRSKAQQIYYSTIMLLPDHAGAQYSSDMSNEEIWKTFGNAWKLFRTTVEAATTNLYPSDLSTVKSSYQQVGIGPLGDTNELWEPNDYWWETVPISAGSSIDSYISTVYDDDFYRVNLTSSGTLSIKLSNLPADYELVLYGPDWELLDYSTTSFSYDENIVYPISSAGTYYIRVLGYNGAYHSAMPYRLSTWFSSVRDTLEPDRATPKNISFGTVYNGYIISPNDIDYYEVNVNSAGNIAMWLDPLAADYDAYLCDSNWNVIGGSTHTSTKPEWVLWWAPGAGKYYIIIDGHGKYSNTSYKLNFAYYTDKLDNHEPSDAFAYPRGPLTSGSAYDGKIYNYVDEDFYKINVASNKIITINLTNLPADYDLYLYKADGTYVTRSINSGTTSETISISVTAGEYRIGVYGYNGAYNQSNMYRLTANF